MVCLFILSVLTPVCRAVAQNPYGLRAETVFRCDAGPVTLTATVDPGADPQNIRWYDQPFYGTPIGTGPSLTIEYLDQDKTFFIDYIFTNADGLEECGICDRIAVRAVIFYDLIESRLFYDSNVLCNTPGVFSPTISGIGGGTFSYVQISGSGTLALDTQTGMVNPEESGIGVYTIYYNPPVLEGCDVTPATFDMEITGVGEPPLITYPDGGTYCTTSGQVSVNQSGAANGIYTTTPAGLKIDQNTGAITPAESLGGTYTVSYFIPSAGGCPPQSATTQVTIVESGSATIAYDGPFCGSDETTAHAIFSGTPGGNFSYERLSEGGGSLSLSSDGSFVPADSEPGTYRITYTIPANEVCAPVAVSTELEVLSRTLAVISVAQSEVCRNEENVRIEFTGMNDNPPYTFTYSLNDGPSMHISSDPETDTAYLEINTAFHGSYHFRLLQVSGSSGCTNPLADQELTLTVTEPAKGLFFYAGTPYCSNGPDNPVISLEEGSVAGEFSASPAGLVLISTSTGEINLSASQPGEYTVYNTIAASGGCPSIVAETIIRITQLPVADFQYEKSTYTQNEPNPAPVYLTIGGVTGQAGGFSSDSPFLVFSSDADALPGTIDLSASLTGTYVVTNTILEADGCGEVSASFSVTIEDAPAPPHIDYSPAPGLLAHFCNSQAQATVMLQGQAGGTFTISPSTGLPVDAVTGTLTTLDATPGEYTITYTADGFDPVTAEVKIYPKPTADAGPDQAICDGQPASLIGSIGGSAISSVWSTDGDGTFDDPASLTATYSPGPQDKISGEVSIYLSAFAEQHNISSDPDGEPVFGPCQEAVSELTLTINMLPENPVASHKTVTYDGEEHSASATSDGAGIDWYDAAEGGNPVSAPTGTNAGNYTAWAEARYAGTTECISAERVLVTLSIEPKELTVINALVEDKVYDGTNDAVITGAELSGLIEGDDVTLGDDEAGTFAQTGAGTGIEVSTAMTISGTDAANYSLIQPALTGNILVALPEVETAAATAIGYESATLNGEIPGTGGEEVTRRGFLISTEQGFDPDGEPGDGEVLTVLEEEGSFGPGSFSMEAVGLDQGTIYYVRAFAANSAGTTYGTEEEFATDTEPVK